jgi:hypothetical protein
LRMPDTDDHIYVPFVIATTPSSLTYHQMFNKSDTLSTQSIEEQGLLTPQEYLNSPLFFCWVRDPNHI